jgi:hypothetical protein
MPIDKIQVLLMKLRDLDFEMDAAGEDEENSAIYIGSCGKLTVTIHVAHDEMCACGRGKIERDPETGISLHQVFLDSHSFGRAEYGDCCKECCESQRREGEEDSIY